MIFRTPAASSMRKLAPVAALRISVGSTCVGHNNRQSGHDGDHPMSITEYVQQRVNVDGCTDQYGQGQTPSGW